MCRHVSLRVSQSSLSRASQYLWQSESYPQTVYHTGSTALHSDLALYGRLYKPDIAIIILSANRDPRDAAEMVRLLLTDNPNLKTVLPHHHRVKPPEGAASPAAMEAEIKKLGLPVTFLNPELGKVYSFTK